MNDMARRAAVMSAMGKPSNALGISENSSRSRIVENRSSASEKPTA